jgi:hemerythrin superfamily protein
MVILVALLALSLLAGCPKKTTPTGMEENRRGTGYVATPSTENRQPKLVGELRDDHAKVKSMLADLEKVTDQKDAPKKLTDLRQALVPHMRAEERVVYPAMASVVGQDMIKTSISEHRAAGQMVTQLQAMQANDPKFAQKVADLTKAIDMHIAREEGQMFPQGEKVVNTQQWDQLKDQFDKTKDATLDALKRGGEGAETATTTPSGTSERGTSQQSSKPAY